VKQQSKKIDPLTQIAPLIEAVQIMDIRLVEASVGTSIRSANEAGEVDLTIRRSADVKEYNKDASMFWVLVKIKTELIQREPKKGAAVFVNVVFEIKYSLPKELEVSQEQLNTFAKINSVFNAWPYWREFVQSMVARMNLPPLTLPMFRFGNATKVRRKKPTEIQ